MPLVVYVDVDDTLVRWAGSKPIPIPGVVAELRRLRTEGAELYCWSAAGAELAREVAERIGVEDLFRAFLPKPTLLIDDRPLEVRTIHPTHCDVERPSIDHADDAQIDAALRRTPRERLQVLEDMIAFEERAQRARRVS